MGTGITGEEENPTGVLPPALVSPFCWKAAGDSQPSDEVTSSTSFKETDKTGRGHRQTSQELPDCKVFA